MLEPWNLSMNTCQHVDSDTWVCWCPSIQCQRHTWGSEVKFVGASMPFGHISNYQLDVLLLFLQQTWNQNKKNALEQICLSVLLREKHDLLICIVLTTIYHSPSAICFRLRSLQLSGDGRVSELANDLKLKAFELERCQLVLEETVKNHKETQLEVEKLSKKAEVSS